MKYYHWLILAVLLPLCIVWAAPPPIGTVTGPPPHNNLNGRSATNAHPMSAVTGLDARFERLSGAIGTGGGVTVHDNLTGKDAANQHPMGAVTGLLNYTSSVNARFLNLTGSGITQSAADARYSNKAIMDAYTSAGNGRPTADEVAATYQKKVVISVEDYGAVGDGVTSDTVAWRNAIAAAPEGATIVGNPSHTYYLDIQPDDRVLEITKALTLDFNGAKVIYKPWKTGDAAATHFPAIWFHGSLGTAHTIQAATTYGTTITLNTASDSSNYEVGDWIYLMNEATATTTPWNGADGIYPTYRFYAQEPQQIQAINAGTGVITLTRKLDNVYPVNSTIQKMNLLRSPKVINISDAIEEDSNIQSTKLLYTGDSGHLISIQYAHSPLVENVSARDFRMFVLWSQANINPVTRRLSGNNYGFGSKYRAYGGHSYLTRMQGCIGSLAEANTAHGTNKFIDYTNSYDGVSIANVGHDTAGIGTHGYGSRRITSIDDAVYGAYYGWGFGNVAFNADYDVNIIRFKYVGSGEAIYTRSNSENANIVDPNITVTGGGAAGISILSGSKKIKISGGTIDTSAVTSPAIFTGLADNAISMTASASAGMAQTVTVSATSHGLSVGQSIYVVFSDVTKNAEYTGTRTVATAATDSFTFADVGSGSGLSSTAGIIWKAGNWHPVEDVTIKGVTFKPNTTQTAIISGGVHGDLVVQDNVAIMNDATADLVLFENVYTDTAPRNVFIRNNIINGTAQNILSVKRIPSAILDLPGNVCTTCAALLNNTSGDTLATPNNYSLMTTAIRLPDGTIVDAAADLGGGAGITGTTDGLLSYYDSSDSRWEQTSQLFYDDTNNRLGVITATPQAAVDIYSSTPNVATMLVRSEYDGTASTGGTISLYMNNAKIDNYFTAPTNTARIGQFLWGSKTGTEASGSAINAASITAFAEGNWENDLYCRSSGVPFAACSGAGTGTVTPSTPTYLGFYTTPSGSSTRTEKMRVTGAGDLLVGNTDGTSKITATGVIESTTGGFKLPDGTVVDAAADLGGTPVIKVIAPAGTIAAGDTHVLLTGTAATTITRLADYPAMNGFSTYIYNGNSNAQTIAPLSAGQKMNYVADGSYSMPPGKGAHFTYIDDATYESWYVIEDGAEWTTSGSNIYYNAGKIGVGTVSPTDQITASLAGTGAIAAVNTSAYGANSGALVKMMADPSTAAAVDAADRRLGGALWGGAIDTSHTFGYGASIEGFSDGAWSSGTDTPAYLSIKTAPDGGTRAERLRVKSTGVVRFVPIATPASCELGDTYVNSSDNKMYSCTTAGTPGTWTAHW